MKKETITYHFVFLFHKILRFKPIYCCLIRCGNVYRELRQNRKVLYFVQEMKKKEKNVGYSCIISQLGENITVGRRSTSDGRRATRHV